MEKLNKIMDTHPALVELDRRTSEHHAKLDQLTSPAAQGRGHKLANFEIAIHDATQRLEAMEAAAPINESAVADLAKRLDTAELALKLKDMDIAYTSKRLNDLDAVSALKDEALQKLSERIDALEALSSDSTETT